MIHSFSVDEAKRYGMVEATILYNIRYWVEKNRANNANYYEGKYWTYNSVKAFSLLFPYLTAAQIRYAIDNLVKMGAIEKGNFNKMSKDRTSWYTVIDGSICHDYQTKTVKNGKKDDSHLLNLSNDTFANFNKPLPDINTDINNTNTNTVGNASHLPTEGAPEKKLEEVVYDHLNEVRKKHQPSASKLKMTPVRARAVLKRKKEFDALWPGKDFIKACRLMFEMKAEEWIAKDDMWQYFMPETLLNGENFVKYIEQLINKDKAKKLKPKTNATETVQIISSFSKTKGHS